MRVRTTLLSCFFLLAFEGTVFGSRGEASASDSRLGISARVHRDRDGRGEPSLQSSMSPLHPVERVIGGEDAEEGEFPWMVTLMNGDEIDPNWAFFCGGTLIGEKWVLTAAHCVLPTSLGLFFENLEVAVVPLRHDDVVARTPAAEIYIHPDYDETVSNHDIALIRLSEPATVAPLRSLVLPSNAEALLAPGQSARLIGFGLNHPNRFSLPSVLQKVELPVVSDDTCRAATQRYAPSGELYTENMLCAGWPQGGRGACSGDSGSPLLVTDENGDTRLAGITSWTFGCALENRYSFFTRVSQYSGPDGWLSRCIEDPSQCPVYHPAPEDYFECSDGRFVATERRCDAWPDCDGGEDEADCDAPFLCDDGTEIPAARVCNGIVECVAAEDERDCVNSMTCPDGSAVVSEAVCNGTPDCPQGEDELDCTLFSCGDGQTVGWGRRCDYSSDCVNGADEAGCGLDPYVCDDGQTVAPGFECDYSPQCAGGEDESACPWELPVCNDGTPLSALLWCDGWPNCPQGEDEGLHCDYSDSFFICGDGTGVLELFRCDGHPNCVEGEDELDCTPQMIELREPEPPGKNCPDGGIKVTTATDHSLDGEVSPWEVDEVEYICDGGAEDGKSALVRLTEEPAGENCVAGGTKMETGLDDNGNDVLDDDEVESIRYICDGEDGEDGEDAVLSCSTMGGGGRPWSLFLLVLLGARVSGRLGGLRFVRLG
ncbi:MAG: trypsin-like serine protease [Myxococcales bacterium FL481]|nr:MAG: trypsin-like serine protease [Myxococcales bacterium FL481]